MYQTVVKLFVEDRFPKWSKTSLSFPKHQSSVPHKETMIKLLSFNTLSNSDTIVFKVDYHHKKYLLKINVT